VKAQIAKYLAVFAIIFLFGWIASIPLSGYGFSTARTLNILTPLGAILKFLLYKYWVFRNLQPEWLKQPLVYAIVVLIGWGLSNGTQSVLEYMGASEWWALAEATLFVGCLRFLLFRHLFKT
jgi:hypothetical protein